MHITRSAKINPQDALHNAYSDVYEETSAIPASTLNDLINAGINLPNLETIRSYRLSSLLRQMEKQKVDAVLLFDPINIRYATDSKNMQVWTSHNLARAALVTSDAYLVLWDFTGCKHLTEHLSEIDEIRTGAGSFYFEHGDKTTDQAISFVDQILSLLKQKGAGLKLAIDRMDTAAALAFLNSELIISDAWPVMEHARLIKCDEEINAMRCAIFATHKAMEKMENSLCPGLSEVELWSILHAENIALGGEWIETRLLSSGPRTNPWMSEASGRIIKNGDLLAFDTDMIGLFGVCCDVSRTWLTGDGDASDEQKTLYRVAHEHIEENMHLLKPGVTFRDLTFSGHDLPDLYKDRQYCVKMHGVGLCDEFPSIYYPESYIEDAVDYELKPNMVLCVEAYVGELNGREGVKLENQVLVTESGFENLSTYHYDKRLMGTA